MLPVLGTVRYRRIPPNDQVRMIFGSALLAHWPCNESAGAVVSDVGGNARDVAYVGGTLADTTSKLGRNAPLFTTPIGGINLGGNAPLLASINGDEGAFMVTMKMSAVGNWLTATQDYLMRLTIDGNNYMRFYRTSGSNFPTFGRAGQAEAKTCFIYMYPSDWTHLIVSWSVSGGYIRMYQNGTRDHGTAVTTGVTKGWVGSIDPAIAKLFTLQTVPTAFSLRGWACDAMFLNRPITDSEALAVSRLMLPGLKIMSFLGDSIIAASNGYKYSVFVGNEHYGGLYRRIHHAYAGAGILDGALAAQVAASANDDADVIIIHIGTNDDNAGDMNALKNTFGTQLSTLRSTNPRATIYVAGVLPRWTDVGGGTPVDKSNIRAAQAEVCGQLGIEYWDLFTVPAITSAQTTDGMHPTSIGLTGTGHRAMADRMLTELA